MASWLKRLRPRLDGTIVEPSTQHHYQSGWVLVAGGFVPVEDTSRPERPVMPVGVRWIHSRITAFDPDSRAVLLLGGRRIGNGVLIVALGIEPGWRAIPGLLEALGRDGVISIYGRRFATHARQVLENFRGARPSSRSRRRRSRAGARPRRSSTPPMTASSGAAASGWPAATCSARPSRNCSRCPPTPNAWPASPPTRRRDPPRPPPRGGGRHGEAGRVRHPRRCRAAAAAGAWLRPAPRGAADDGEPRGGRHRRYGEVFAIGDVGSFPTAKTAAAVRKQAPVIARKLLAVLDGREPTAVYDGYSACPRITSDHTVMLMEFDCSRRPVSSFLVDPVRERWSLWPLERFGFAWIYRNRMLRGLPHEGGWLKPLEPLALSLGLCRWQRRERQRPIPGSEPAQGG